MKYIMLVGLVIAGCSESGTCVEEALVVSSSASEIRCSNKRHKIVVKESTKSGKDITTVVVCECISPTIPNK
jgi:hypothetical protein